MTTKFKKKFIELLSELSIEVYEELGGGNFDEKDFQKALGYEFSEKKIDYLREIHLELYYKKIPLKLGAPDFFLNDLNPPAIIEIKLGSGLDDANRHQLKMYLNSIQKRKNKIVRNINNGYLINFLKIEPLINLEKDRKPKNKTIYKIEIEHYKLSRNSSFLLIDRLKSGPIEI